MQKKQPSWGVIILIFFVFFPVGIAMAIPKIQKEPRAYVTNGRIAQGCGAMLIFMAFVYFLAALTGQVEAQPGYADPLAAAALLMVVFGGGGLFVVYRGFVLVARGKRYARFEAVIQAESDRSLTSLAAAYPTTREKAVDDLQAMIDCGYLTNAWIDYTFDRLVLVEPTKPTRSLVCSGCGATVTAVVGEVAVCEYCGSKIS